MRHSIRIPVLWSWLGLRSCPRDSTIPARWAVNFNDTSSTYTIWTMPSRLFAIPLLDSCLGAPPTVFSSPATTETFKLLASRTGAYLKAQNGLLGFTCYRFRSHQSPWVLSFLTYFHPRHSLFPCPCRVLLLDKESIRWLDATWGVWDRPSASAIGLIGS